MKPLLFAFLLVLSSPLLAVDADWEMVAALNDRLFQAKAASVAPPAAGQPFTLFSLENPVGSGVNVFIKSVGYYCKTGATLQAYVGSPDAPTGMSVGRAYSCKTYTTITAQALIKVCSDGLSSAITYEGPGVIDLDFGFTTAPMWDTHGSFVITPGVRVDFVATSDIGLKPLKGYMKWGELPTTYKPAFP